MKKLLTFIVTIISACVLSGVYGILHDQFTYTISPEYYTKFKFDQFFVWYVQQENESPDPRLLVALVGFVATWWVGLPIGTILGLLGFIHEDWRQMARYVAKGFLITVIVGLIAGLSGLAYGFVVLANQPRESFAHWYIPGNITDFRNYIAVGSMHNMSYAGGMIGMVLGGAYIVGKRMKVRSERRFKVLWTKEN